MTTPNATHEILHHFLAALAYRMQKALRGAPDDFGTFEGGHGIRTPQAILHHVCNVLNHARRCFGDAHEKLKPLSTFEEEIDRFHAILETLGAHLEAGTPLAGTTPEQLLQGPFSDAMTHAGQIAMLRRMAGSPVPPENFMAATIARSNLSANQPAPAKPLDNWQETLDSSG